MSEVPQLTAGFVETATTSLSQAIEYAQTGPFGTQLTADDYVDGGVPVINPIHIQRGYISPDDSTTVTPEKAEDLARYRLAVGDIVLGRKGEVDKSALVSQQSKGYVCGSDAMALRPRMGTVPDYLWWFLQSSEAHSQLEYWSVGSTVSGLNQNTIRKVRLHLPNVQQQQRIADYLDRETARIDTLIEEQQRLIEMLRGRRRALVERVVFGGLDNAATTTNPESWLPSTPSHWRVVQLGFVCDTLAGYAFPSDGFSPDEDHVRLLRGINVKPGRTDWAETVYWDPAAAPVPVEFELEPGDLVFGMDRPFVGGGVRIASVSEDDLPALLLQRVMRIRPNAGGDREYLRYVMSSDAFLIYLEPLFTGVSVPHVSEWQVRKFKMPFPPLNEQCRIAAHLDEQTQEINQLITETEGFVELARERRSALITAAVTGQIDVREAA